MKRAQCPSCGAEVLFRSEASVMAVCEYCQSTLVRHDQNVEDIGKMATLAEDASPLRRGVRGVWQGVGFSLIGRIQLQYAAGYWNEWYALFEDGRQAWVSEGSGQAYITFPSESKSALPPWDRLTPGMAVTISGKHFTLTDKEDATVVAGEGELPFQVGAGYHAPAADFSAEDGSFISLDYSEETPRAYSGWITSYAALKLDDSAAEAKKVRTISARTFNCKACGAPAVIRNPESVTYACPSCGAEVDLSDPGYKQIHASRIGLRITPQIPLGIDLKLRGDQLSVLGFMRRRSPSDGILYEWDEYLLYGDKAGFRWLVQSDGHWSYGRMAPNLPQGTNHGGSSAFSYTAHYDGKIFKHFGIAVAEVTYVAGEFNWRVQAGDKAECNDYIAPPQMLSKEVTSNEVTWTLSEYLPLAELRAACPQGVFSEPRGVGACQPMLYPNGVGRFWGYFILFVCIGFVVQVASVIFSPNKVVYTGRIELQPGATTSITSAPFQIEHSGNLALTNQASLENNWADLSMTLINRNTGEGIALEREISYYSGVDEDGHWSEGSPRDEAFINYVPAGEYVLDIEADAPRELPQVTTDQITIRSNQAIWGNLWLLLSLLLVFPALASWRQYRHEAARWANSDHPISVSNNDDDDY